VVRPWPAEHLPPDEDSAYRLQARIIAATGRDIAGWKVGLTSPAIRAQTGLSEPIYGPVLAGNVHASPHELRREDFGRLGIELEIALFLGADLPAQARPGRRKAWPCRGGSGHVVRTDRRSRRRLRPADVRQLIVDGSWQAGVQIGRKVPMDVRPDLEHGAGALTVNGRVVAAAPANAGMGHCFNVLAWLANRLARTASPCARTCW